MKRRTHFLTALIGSLALSLIAMFWHGKEYSQKDFDGLRRLTGTWQGGKPSVQIFEVWKAGESGRLDGLSYRIAGGNRKDLENVRLFLQDGAIIYAPTTVGQNDEKEVPFTLTRIHDDEYLFENPAHDFPTRISYKFVGKDSLHAYIEGKQSGETIKMYFNYSRVKQK